MLSRLPPRRAGRPRCCKAGDRAHSKAGGGDSWRGMARHGTLPPSLAKVPPSWPGGLVEVAHLSLLCSVLPAGLHLHTHAWVLQAQLRLKGAGWDPRWPCQAKWVDIPREMGGLGSLPGDTLVPQPSSTTPSAVLPAQPRLGPSTATSRMAGDLFVPATCPRAMGHP